MSTPLLYVTTYWRIEYEYIKYGCDSLFFGEDNFEINAFEANQVEMLNIEIDKIKNRLKENGKTLTKILSIYEREV